MTANMKASEYITGFDSSTSMLYSLGNCLHGRHAPFTVPTKLPSFIGDWLDALPDRIRQDIYTWGGYWDAISPKTLTQVDSEAISALAVEQYPKRNYPAVMIGSSNGAAVHLCSTLGIPWLPQTFLLAVAAGCIRMNY